MLSFFSIFGIQNNVKLSDRYAKGLWIAFIFQYLWDTKQRLIIKLKSFSGCELLSFFSIFGIQNNLTLPYQQTHTVVNCFHFSVSLGYKTTWWLLIQSLTALWIAFIFQYLWDTKQLRIRSGYRTVCCELLSFFSIFGIQNNRYLKG